MSSLQEGKFYFPPSQFSKKKDSESGDDNYYQEKTNTTTTTIIPASNSMEWNPVKSSVDGSSSIINKNRKYAYSIDGNNQFRASSPLMQGVNLTPPLPHCTAGSSIVDLNKPPSFKKNIKHKKDNNNVNSANGNGTKSTNDNVVLIIIYAVINSIMCIPCIYGYASVIFNNPVFAPHINALSKLVMTSSVVHQLCFSYFSSLDFSVGQVQDAGLLFLSAMSNVIANKIMDDGGSVEEVIATSIVLLPLGTATLGFVVFLMGKYRLADMVSYLPVPVVGGYLAFIGYFCLQAGVALCIGYSMIEFKDWIHLFNWQSIILATPGLISGAIFVIISKKCVNNDFALPASMILIPVAFYITVFVIGDFHMENGMDDARSFGWLGAVSEPTPVSSVIELFSWKLVRWDLIVPNLSTWVGMVFVVSFSSCLDVSAISIDMGEPLDTNNELATVGLSNLISGLLGGYTGSYIFSQTIFTYRTNCWNRAIGILIAIAEFLVVVSTVNVLQVIPLFFLGATLIFIGFELMYEWIVEIRHKLLVTEYFILIATFLAIQIVGIDFGIVIGIVVAIVDYVVANSKVSSLHRLHKRSRTVWNPYDRKLLQEHGYHTRFPKIVTLEIHGSVFFGSSLQVFTKICDEIGLEASIEDKIEMTLESPLKPRGSSVVSSPYTHAHKYNENESLLKSNNKMSSTSYSTVAIDNTTAVKPNPLFVVLQLSQVPIVDVSAARGCFLQLAKMCSKKDIVLCAAGANSKSEWMLRSHDVAYNLEEEEILKKSDFSMLKKSVTSSNGDDHDIPKEKILLFENLYDALEFCEVKLLEHLGSTQSSGLQRSLSGLRLYDEDNEQDEEKQLSSHSSSQHALTMSGIFANILGYKEDERLKLVKLDRPPFSKECAFNAGDTIFLMNSKSDNFYVILKGSVGMLLDTSTSTTSPSSSLLANNHSQYGQVKAYLHAGGILGYVDFILDQPRTFSIVAVKDGTILAMITRKSLMDLRENNDDLHLERVVDKVLLQISAHELCNAPDP